MINTNIKAEILDDEELNDITGGWISSEDLYNNRDYYIGKNFTMSKAGFFFGIHETIADVQLLNVWKDKEGNTMISYRVIENLASCCSPSWSFDEKSNEMGKKYYNSSSNCFLTLM